MARGNHGRIEHYALNVVYRKVSVRCRNKISSVLMSGFWVGDALSSKDTLDQIKNASSINAARKFRDEYKN